MTVKDLHRHAATRIEVMSGYNGKVLCKKFNSEKHANIAEREVTSIWAEIRTQNSGFNSFSSPVICVYVDGTVECEIEATKEINPTA